MLAWVILAGYRPRQETSSDYNRVHDFDKTSGREPTADPKIAAIGRHYSVSFRRSRRGGAPTPPSKADDKLSTGGCFAAVYGGPSLFLLAVSGCYFAGAVAGKARISAMKAGLPAVSPA
ncbi:MAG: hypothetical protein WA709_20305 [Stellaceae bacterium]